ncbi:MAG: response regulator transcription factor [Saccharospirillaceae bacterium]|nr:response regulator transcription factor [Pseudomonadales bacterium]NRB80162.1 response regulator transcription factor [Saccharospirillaceae bacterium]
MNILIVDDHSLFREGLAMVLQTLADNCIVFEAQDGDESLDILRDKIRDNIDIDIILLDYNLPNYKGIELMVKMKEIDSSLPIAILSGENNSELIQLALKSGASGFITKNSSSDVMLKAIGLILSGGIYIPPDILNVTPNDLSSTNNQLFNHISTDILQKSNAATNSDSKAAHPLTPRQIDVLKQVALGLANKEIARVLDMSPSTVKVHIAAILRELDVKNRTQAAGTAQQLGLI